MAFIRLYCSRGLCESTSYTRFGRDYVEQLIEEPIPTFDEEAPSDMQWHRCLHSMVALVGVPSIRPWRLRQWRCTPQTDWPEAEVKYQVYYGVGVYSWLRH